MNLMCFKHKYPLVTIVKETKFKKFLGRVRSMDVDCYCPDCGMEITYSFKVKKYRKGVGSND